MPDPHHAVPDAAPRQPSPPPHALPAARALLLCAAVLGAGCASGSRPDPLEPVNRKMFAFNEGVDKVVLKPVATAYKAAVPPVAQTGISNFLSNLQEPWSSANLVFQGQVREGAANFARFGTNTTVGLLGFVDVASGWGMPQRGAEDFGLTLDTWGLGTGAYVVLPVFGASNVRDLLASPIDSVGRPGSYVDSVSARNTLTVVQAVSQRARHLEAGELVDQAALDKYAFMRDAHFKRRNRPGPQEDAARAGMLPPE
ncbi:phospholipid-binding lipoprotein MlaA [Paracidovorax anthurii]|uniref:Phospholipid-binding lipoprotein MlaA n=1 Tax=Paracidovorax anthurii TaxID=78229 RepID=A0A328Z051_9BURK|nr:VacJ family lipoprotein [Paracidovorax anthurii]RAR76197.1 phospholipid-binding lipoprotein MlaA [Paracidovorax anthurii]